MHRLTFFGNRQSGSIGDPGEALCLMKVNTFDNFTLRLNFKVLGEYFPRNNVESRLRNRNSPTSLHNSYYFSCQVLKPRGNTFLIKQSAPLPADLNNQKTSRFIRITYLDATIGGGLRASTGLNSMILHSL
jgi:hypothetical protein